MRYLNWDVLLFPGSSRVPLQEFDTKCHVLPDTNNRFIDYAAPNSNLYLNEIEPMSQSPVLTSFVSSLEQGSPFRVSVHSWDTPKPSQILRTFKTNEETVAFEARLYLDGNMVAQRIFDDQAIWPEVIDAAGDIDTTHPKPIRFPVFHSEILDQTHWEPGEMYGRIRIVVAEGVLGQAVDARTRPTFDRLRDIVAFSFQHAPRHILEYSGIAWPSARLFRRAARMTQDSIASRFTTIPDFEAHAHSPQRQLAPGSTATGFGLDASAFFGNNDRQKESSRFEDPFVGPMPISLREKHSQLRRSSNEIYMKDFNSIGTARSHAGTDMSGVSYQRPDFERAINEAAIDEIVHALSPERKRDLVQALSPGKNTRIGVQAINGIGPVDSNSTRATEQQFLISSPLSTLLNPHGFPRTSALIGNVLASRSSSVPSLTPSHTASDSHGLSHGFRSSMDPLLPAVWNQTASSIGQTVAGQAIAPLEFRPRSTSNASKRKRQESPRTDIATEHPKNLSMSAPSCKCDTTPIASLSKKSLVDEGVLLGKQE